MTPRERVHATLHFQAPDRIPIQVHGSPAGLYEHGQKLLDAVHALGHDFGDLSGLTLPAPPASDFDADGRYHVISTDAWGVTWEYRIFGVWGHPLRRPLDDLAALSTWRPPAPPPLQGFDFEAARVNACKQRKTWCLLGGGGSLWERLYFLHGFEDSLVDVQQDTPEINRLADILAEYCAGCVAHALALGVDGVAFGDDFGTQQAPIFAPTVWRRFFKPRYETIFEPVRKAGLPILFHSCGQVMPLLEDLRELGVTAIWPQLPLFDLSDLARRCRELHLAVQLHPDRGDLMQHGTAQQVRTYLQRLIETFDSAHGGSWLYLEVDPGFKWETVDALFAFAHKLRHG